MQSGGESDRIPVTLLTGFLGAGKTTLLNHLIRDPDAGRIAVIMNEFGDVGLDHDLIEEATGEIALLSSGCLCCTIRGDLTKTLCSLNARRLRGELAFDRVVIETTGIADPGPILHSMVVERVIAPHFRMDGVVTLADAATGPRIFDQQAEAVQQVATADLIVLSKTDLVGERELGQFEARLDRLNPTARRIRADHGRIPPGHLFGLSAMRANVTTPDIDRWLGAAEAQPDPLAGLTPFGQKPSASGSAFLSQTLAAGAGQMAHDHRFSSASIEINDPIPADVFDSWLKDLIALNGPNILRMKGIVFVEGVACPFVFHGVQHIFDAPVPLESWTGSGTTSRVVVIARDIAAEALEAQLDPLRRRPDPPKPAGPKLSVRKVAKPF